MTILTSECVAIYVGGSRRGHILWGVYVFREYVPREGRGYLYSALASTVTFLTVITDWQLESLQGLDLCQDDLERRLETDLWVW